MNIFLNSDTQITENMSQQGQALWALKYRDLKCNRFGCAKMYCTG